MNLQLTSDELRALVNEVDVVLRRHIDRYKADPSPNSRPVHIQLNAFPLVRGDSSPTRAGQGQKERKQ